MPTVMTETPSRFTMWNIPHVMNPLMTDWATIMNRYIMWGTPHVMKLFIPDDLVCFGAYGCFWPQACQNTAWGQNKLAPGAKTNYPPGAKTNYKIGLGLTFFFGPAPIIIAL